MRTRRARRRAPRRFATGCGSASSASAGPPGQIAIMHRELVDEKRWISERRFLHALNYCMVLPGPEAQQLATYIGWLMHRTWGGIVAGALFVLPSLVLLIALSWLYIAYGDVPAVAGVLYGIKPAVVAIVLHAAWRIGSRALKHPALWVDRRARVRRDLRVRRAVSRRSCSRRRASAASAAASLPQAFAVGGAHAADEPRARAGGASTTTRRRRRTRDSRWPRLARGRRGLRRALGAARSALLVAASRLRRRRCAQMGWFFTKAALLTFGGAYAVLPYVYQGAVETFGWLTPAQMIDGLALGETTPGPLIMVVAFVGFVGGWTKALFGAGRAVRSPASPAPCVATFFTFLPSFLFILAGGPLVEIDARPAPLHGAADRHHRGGRRRHRQPRAVLRLARVLARQGGIDVAAMLIGAGRGACAVPLQARRDPGHRRLRRWPGSRSRSCDSSTHLPAVLALTAADDQRAAGQRLG